MSATELDLYLGLFGVVGFVIAVGGLVYTIRDEMRRRRGE